MEYSLSMQFVMMRANAEMKAAHIENEGIEHLFLGLLKLAELRAADIVNAPEQIENLINSDIDVICKQFSELNIDTTRTRSLLRYMVSAGITFDADALEKCIDLAKGKANERKASMIWAQDMLSAILEMPTDTILQVCPIHESRSSDGRESNNADSHAKDEMNKRFLSDLTNRIRHMRAQLLSAVYGQDHVVHAFAEGMFAAEVLAASDEKRKRPRAIFVFVGPPGVGKTYLAEQAAAALSIPYKRFDMSSYADHQSYMGLVGFEKSYHGAKTGTLTSFVKKNPHSILLFDEIEKAHLNTINLFLQIMDAGRLNDRYLDEDISFKDTVIVFTSNAGKSLYEGEAKDNAAGIPRKVILNALETEMNPQTGMPFFPATITSRMSTGWTLLFNHLQAHHLEKISSGEMTRLSSLFERQYEIKVKYDDMVPTALLLVEGGHADARTLRAQTEQFFKNEIFKVCRLWGEKNFATALENINYIHFTIDPEKFPDEVRSLFVCKDKPEVLLYGSLEFADRCKAALPNYVIYHAQNAFSAMKIAGEKNIRLAIIDIAERSKNTDVDGYALSSFMASEYSTYLKRTEGAFDFAPMGTGAIHDGTSLFRSIRERLPDLPVYLLETDDFLIDAELEMSFMRAGARGKLVEPKENFSVFEDVLETICSVLYAQSIAMKMASERKALFFDTAPILTQDRTEITIRLRDFVMKKAIAADDMSSILDDIEKPDAHFLDVIGAVDAKEELQFYIDYLKEPRRFTAQGLKPPKGLLLYGPPGTGKTMLAKAMAGESDVTFIPCVATNFVTEYQGSGPKAIRMLFERARRYAPAIIFIDEIDAIGRKRGQANSGHGEEMALNALLAEMDGFSVDPKRPVFVLAATNFSLDDNRGGLGVIDPALSRRFDCKILVDLPNADEREQFIRMTLQKNKSHIVSEEMIKRLATRSVGMSPSYLASVFETATRMSVKEHTILDDSIVEEAFEQTKHGAKRDWGYEYLERVARHEAGHALLSYLSGNTPSYLTIVARGTHGGYMERADTEEDPLSTKEELLSQIRTALGGRAAEITYYSDENGISTGAANDLMQATNIASAMICKYGMDSSFGIGVLGNQDSSANSGVALRVNEMLREELDKAVEAIRANTARIDRLVNELMAKNKLSGQEVGILLNEYGK